jgi:hypothetical protein
MESNSVKLLKKSIKQNDVLFKKCEPPILKSAKRSNNLNCSFELPILCVKKSRKPNRKDIYSYSIYNKNDLNASFDYRDFENEFENDSSSSVLTTNNNNNSKNINNLSKILVTLKIKKETSLRHKFLSNEQLPLLKSAISRYNNCNYNNNVNLFKKTNIYSPLDFNEHKKSDEEIPYFSKKSIKIQNDFEDVPMLSYQMDQNYLDSYRPSVTTEKSFAWTNMEKVLNKRMPENPPATPILY